MKDPYAVLGVPRDATGDQIKRAYRKLAQELHPDRDPGNAAAENRFKEVSAAYSLLSNKAQRDRFDRGEVDAAGNQTRRGPRPEQPRGARHPFGRFFRNRAARDGGAGIKVDGADVTYSVSVDFAEAARGTTTRVDTTNGKRLEVKIPPGTRDGQVLRLKDQGMPGMGGGAPGAARVTVTVRPHPMWRQEGWDLHADLAISLSEAVLGGRVEVETMDGKVMVTVPKDANTGTVLRLKGKGLARPDGGSGDLLVRLAVTLPAEHDADLVDLVRRWAKNHPYEVRRTRTKVD